MKSAQDYWHDVQHLLSTHGFILNGSITLSYNTKEEANRHLSKTRQLEKELKQIKKDASQSIKEIKAVYTQRKQRISSSTGLASTFHIKGARNMGAHDKQRITAEQHANVAPYEVVTANIDKMVLQFDGIKVNISAWLLGQKQ